MDLRNSWSSSGKTTEPQSNNQDDKRAHLEMIVQYPVESPPKSIERSLGVQAKRKDLK